MSACPRLRIGISGSGRRRRPHGRLQELLIAYRFHPENLMTTAAERISRSFGLLSDKHREAAAAAGVDFGAAWFGRWKAARELAAGRRVRAARAYLRGAARAGQPRDLAGAVAALAGGRLERLGRSAEARPCAAGLA